MLFVHSYTPVEQSLQRRLSMHDAVTALDIMSVDGPETFHRLTKISREKVLLYSLQRMDHYRHIQDFQAEFRRVRWLVQWIAEQGFERVILISYPGAYVNSDSLFLQYKGLIEQRFVECGVDTVVLKVQGIHDCYSRRHSFHDLFYDRKDHAYYVPQKKIMAAYSVSVENLAACVLGAMQPKAVGQYDVFDEVCDLPSLLYRHSSGLKVFRLMPVYLYVRSFLGKYQSPTMLELFLRPLVPMYSHRTVRDLGVTLEPKIGPVEPGLLFNSLPTGVRRNGDLMRPAF